MLHALPTSFFSTLARALLVGFAARDARLLIRLHFRACYAKKGLPCPPRFPPFAHSRAALSSFSLCALLAVGSRSGLLNLASAVPVCARATQAIQDHLRDVCAPGAELPIHRGCVHALFQAKNTAAKQLLWPCASASPVLGTSPFAGLFSTAPAASDDSRHGACLTMAYAHARASIWLFCVLPQACSWC